MVRMEHLCALLLEQFHRSGVSFLPDLTQRLYTVSICESYMIQSNECEGIRVYSMRSTQRDDPTTSQTGK
jgi:hypothetical protein